MNKSVIWLYDIDKLKVEVQISEPISFIKTINPLTGGE
jgi:hypothetical protein